MGFIALYFDRRKRGIEKKRAKELGVFWLPCPLCGEPFGGHEVVDDEDQTPFTVVNGQQRVICSDCTRKGKGKALLMDDAIQALEDMANDYHKE